MFPRLSTVTALLPPALALNTAVVATLTFNALSSPTVVNDDVTTFEASDVPVNPVPATASAVPAVATFRLLTRVVETIENGAVPMASVD